MTRKPMCRMWETILFVCLAGCSSKPQGEERKTTGEPPESTRPGVTESAQSEEVKKVFKDFQAALKANDAEKIWALLDSDSQGDAEREARKVRNAFNKATPADQA